MSGTVAATPVRAGGAAWGMLALLTLINGVSYFDRFLLAILLQPIKAELKLSDLQLGLLTGFAFSLFYALIGLPLARLADRGVRRSLIAVSIALWSVATALSGLARSFSLLLLARVGVGVGEAGVIPAAHAMIAERFPPNRRAVALSIFSLGASFGTFAGFGIGAQLEAAFGWRGAFLAAGAPGLLLALLAWGLLPRDGAKREVASNAETAGQAVRSLLADPLYRNIMLGASVIVVATIGSQQWLPAFFERTYQVSRTTIGASLALYHGVAVLAGMILGGLLSDWRTGARPSWPILQTVLVLVIAAPMLVFSYLMPSATGALALSAAGTFVSGFAQGPILSSIQTVVAPHRRASAIALVMFLSALLGLGLGPLLVGGLSDALASRFGELSLRYALVAVSGVFLLWGTSHMIAAMRHWRVDESC